jgi:hypothetical protein
VVWEREARNAVRARRSVVRQLLADESSDEDAELARATTELARTLGV